MSDVAKVLKNMSFKDYDLKPSFQTEIFAEKVFQLCSNTKKLRIAKRVEYLLFCMIFKSEFHKEIAQNNHVLEILLPYEKKYHELRADEEYDEIGEEEQRQFATNMKNLILLLFPSKSYDDQLFYSRAILLAVKIKCSIESIWIKRGME